MADEYHLLTDYMPISGTEGDRARLADVCTDQVNVEQVAQIVQRPGGTEPAHAVSDPLQASSPEATPTSVAMDKLAQRVEAYPVGKPTRSIIRARIIDESASN